MAQAPPADPQSSKVFLDRFEEAEKIQNKYTEAALERHKAEGLHLAVRARWIALSMIAVLMVFINPNVEVIFYLGILACLALNG